MISGVRKLEFRVAKIPACDGQTDEQTTTASANTTLLWL